MLKNLKKVLNIIRSEKILKYKLKIYKEYVDKFPNLARLAFDDIGLRVSLYGRFENNELNVLKHKVFNKIDCNNSSCLDIGANIGNHSIFFDKFFSKVYSFEPHPDNFYLLKFNCKNYKNIKTFEFGASDIDENKEMYIAADTDMGRNSLLIEKVEISNKNKIDEKKINVDLKNLDNFLEKEKIDKIKFIKIDVERYEYKALKGLKKIL